MTNWTARKEGWAGNSDDARDEFEIDYARIVHSASFRRMQGKTQILNLGDSDFYRTRLTHSMEVSQVACGILQHFKKTYTDHAAQPFFPTQTLMQSICLVHDLGHPPFGHGGEVALNFCMRENGGFEGNGQTLRILSRLEKFSANSGANLTRRTLLGILKYPAPFNKVVNLNSKPSATGYPSGKKLLDHKKSKPPKCYLDTEIEIVDWILGEASESDRRNFSLIENQGEKKHDRTLNKSFDCSIMDMADDISNGVHDLEDAISLHLVNGTTFRELVPEEKCTHFIENLKHRYEEEFGEDAYGTFVDKLFEHDGKYRKRQISRLVHYFISNTVIETKDSLFEEPLFRFRAVMADEVSQFCIALKDFVRDTVILSPNVQHMEFRGQQMVMEVFDTFSHDPKRFLLPKTHHLFEQAEARDAGGGARVICDHISGMTDAYLLKMYERLYSPRKGSVFDHL